MEDADDATIDAILKLQLQDLADLWKDRDGDGSHRSDADAALELYRHEIRRADTEVHDHRTAVALGNSGDDENTSDTDEEDEDEKDDTDDDDGGDDEDPQQKALERVEALDKQLDGSDNSTPDTPKEPSVAENLDPSTQSSSPVENGELQPKENKLNLNAVCVVCDEDLSSSESLGGPCGHLYYVVVEQSFATSAELVGGIVHANSSMKIVCSSVLIT
ncbi:MAG: hypothetical protein L6R41_003128 [Letrouitia leprolyta]|nr:MAG: hypothetical protein L6R41_003128 [Letrouitia leprolyta]